MTYCAIPSRGTRRHSFASAILILLTATPVCFAKQDSVPDWVSAAAAQKLPDYPADTNAVVLLDDTTYTVAPNGQATEHYRHVVKILRPQGRDDAIVAVPFDKDTKILSLHVWSIGPDGHQYALKDNEIVRVWLPRPGQLLRGRQGQSCHGLPVATPAASSPTSTSSASVPC